MEVPKGGEAVMSIFSLTLAGGWGGHQIRESEMGSSSGYVLSRAELKAWVDWRARSEAICGVGPIRGQAVGESGRVRSLPGRAVGSEGISEI